MTEPRPTSRPRAPSAGHPFLRLWRGYLQPHLLLLLLSLLLLVFEGGSIGVLSYLVEPVFDHIFVNPEAGAVWTVGLLFPALFVVRAVAGFLQRTVTTLVGMRAVTAVQADMVNHVLRLDDHALAGFRTGELIERIQAEPGIVQGIWSGVLVPAVRDVIALLSLLVVAVRIDPVWTLVAMVALPALVLPAGALQRYVRRKARATQQAAAQRTALLDEILHGLRTIRLQVAERVFSERFRALSRLVVRQKVRTVGGQALPAALIDLAVGVGFFAVVVYGAREVASGAKTVGQLMSFFSAMLLTFQPLRRLGGLSAQYQIVMASLERIFAILDLQPRVRRPPPEIARRAAARLQGSDIAMRDVVVTLGGRRVLDGISLDVAEGAHVALVGPSGAGKSTLFAALTRLVELEAGEIRLGGVSIRELAPELLRRRIAVVTQDPFLFDGTLRENLLLGLDPGDIDEGRLQEVLRAARIDEFLDRLENGLETRLGTRGERLSGGQRQRVAIARALLRDAPVLLLDEATSALDAESERAVREALARLQAGRTTLAIAHRLSTVRRADCILVMDAGRIVARGTHAQLMAESPLYRRLQELQLAEG